MSKGQITIPKNIRTILGVSSGDHITFIVEGDTIRIVNSAIYAMQMLQAEMRDATEITGIKSENDVINLITNMRNES